MKIHFLVKEEQNPYLLKPRIIYTLILCCQKQSLPLCKDLCKKIASYLPWNFAAFQERFRLLTYRCGYKQLRLGWVDKIESCGVRYPCPTCFLPINIRHENCGTEDNNENDVVKRFLKEYDQGKIILEKESETELNALRTRLLLFPYSVRKE